MSEYNDKRHWMRIATACTGAFAVGVLPWQVALATQGTMPHGYGVKSEGMGGVVYALPQDALVGASNPAGMVHIGDRFDFGAAFLKVDQGAEFAGQDFSGSHSRNLYIIPQLGVNKMLDDRSSIGVSLVGNGVGTDYSKSVNIGGLKGPGSTLKQMVGTLSYARKIGDRHSFGLGVMLIRQTLDLDGTSSINLPEGKDSSYGTGVRLGWMTKLTETLTFGASYSSRGYMSKMNKFKRLLAEGGDFDVPETFGMGLAYQKGPLTLGADVERIMWGEIKSLANPGVGSASGAPGDSNGPGFGWRNQTVWRVGGAYDLNSRWTVRAGYNQGTKLIDSHDTYLGVLAPSTNRRHVTVGATYRLARGHELSMAYARSFKEKVKGNGQGPDAITNISMGQHWLSLGYSYKF